MTEPLGRPARILFVEDNSDDVELELAELESGLQRIEHRTVETGPDLRAALEGEAWDAIICDYWMPELSGLDALRAAKTLAPTTPFLLVSGTVGEEVAVDAMRAGADDYVLKSNLTRLATAVQREIRGAEQRAAADLSDKGLRLLADVSAALATTLQRRRVASEVPPLVVRSFGDLCAIDLLDEAGVAFRASIAHASQAEADQVARLDSAHPPRWTKADDTGFTRAGQAPVLVEGLDGAAGDLDAGFVEIARALSLTSAVSIPIYSKDRLTGALHIARRKPYTPLESRILEDMAGRVAMALDNAALYERAQRAVQIRDEFLSIASHELRTPLTSLQLQIQGLRELAEKKRGEWTDERLFRRLDRSVRSLDRLGQLVEGLLDVTRIADNRLRVELVELDLRALTEGVVDRLQDAAAIAGCALTLSPGPPVSGRFDGMRLEQALTNLIANALKYGAGEPVEVSVAEDGDQARVTVWDRGIGIPAGDLERIFGRFERGVSSRNYGGLGLGLFITRRIVEAHRGRVTAENAPGGGAIFSMTLPRTPEAGPREEAPAVAEAASRSTPSPSRDPGDYAVYMVDPEGRILTWNEGAEDIKGHAADDVLGQGFARFFPERDRAEGKPDRLLEASARESRAEDEGWRVRHDGGLFWAHATITAVHDALGRLRGHVVVTRDLGRGQADAHQRHREEQLRLLIDSVEDYGIVLVDPAGRVATWNGGAERLTGYTSDEIVGTPMARLHTIEAIAAGEPAHELERAAAEGRVEGIDWRVRKDGERYRAHSVMTAIREPGTRALRGYAIVTRELGHRRITDLGAIVARVVDDLRSPAEKLGSQLTLRAPPSLLGSWHGARIAQVIVTLVSNAVRFGGGKPIEVELREIEGGARLEVRDRGLGIPPEELAHVFTRFEREAGRRDRATGLGLYLTKNIVLAHGGSIRVASRPGEGTRFVVELPMRPEVAP